MEHVGLCCHFKWHWYKISKIFKWSVLSLLKRTALQKLSNDSCISGNADHLIALEPTQLCTRYSSHWPSWVIGVLVLISADWSVWVQLLQEIQDYFRSPVCDCVDLSTCSCVLQLSLTGAWIFDGLRILISNWRRQWKDMVPRTTGMQVCVSVSSLLVFSGSLNPRTWGLVCINWVWAVQCTSQRPSTSKSLHWSQVDCSSDHPGTWTMCPWTMILMCDYCSC